jgi:hypothetical protein
MTTTHGNTLEPKEAKEYGNTEPAKGTNLPHKPPIKKNAATEASLPT